jgi:dTDP-4-amino-4,6-dideoxygalactose transaminase
MIQFFDIKKQDKKFQNKILNKIKNIISNSSFVDGKEVNLFEKNFQKFCNVKHCITVGNGTDALFIALKSLNLKKNSEVIVPAMTWKSTALAPLNLGLKVRLVDTEKKSSNFNLDDLRKNINKNTKVIIAVHLYGNPADIKEIKKIIKGKKINIIEDAAQAHGAFDFNLKKKIGSIGDMACFSFYPGKNLGAYGDGGCITTNNDKYNKNIRMIKNLGSLNKFNCEVQGVNSRLDTIQAAILNLKLRDLNKNNKKRIKISQIYKRNIRNNKIQILNYKNGCVYHQFIILTKIKKKIIRIFQKEKIQFGQHYPIPLNKLKIFRNYQNKNFKNSEFLAKFGLSLPIDPNLKKKDLLKICQILNKQ